MSTSIVASAVSTVPSEWHQLDWARIHGTGRRLQARMVKATQAGDWRRVKALQRFLARSFSGKALAVRRVTENQGSRTPGVDGITWSTPEEKRQAVESLKRRSYHPRPLRRVNIPKAGQPDRYRPLGILNPVIRGWANYHRAACASKTYASIDAWLWRKTWQWAKRRHLNKSAHWIKAKYFVRMGSRSWMFSAELTDAAEKWKRVTLAKAGDTCIRRHHKIKGDANPFAPTWEPYFEDRLGLKMQGDMKGKAKLLRLWWNQNKRCTLCNLLITKETGWNIHRRIPKCDGGTDSYVNLALLHPNCHRQLHATCLTLQSRPL